MSLDPNFLKVLSNKRRLKAQLRHLDKQSLSDLEGKFCEVVAEQRETLEKAEKEKEDKQSKAKAFLEQARTSGIDHEALLAALGITADDAREAFISNSKSQIKYRYTDGQVWVGIGRKPKWVLDVEARGDDLSNYLV